MYCKKTINSADEFSQKVNYWQETEAENVIIKYHFILKEILFSTAITAAENEQSADVSHKIYIQTYTQVRQLLSADCADQKNKNHKRQAYKAAAEKVIYKDMNKTLLKSLLKYFWVNSLANKIIQSLKAAETSRKKSQYFNWTQIRDLFYVDNTMYISHMKALHNEIL